MTAVLLLALGAVSFCVPAAPRAEVNGGNVADLVDSLFGTVSSRQSFARQAAAETEAAARFAPSRGKELTYGEFDLPFFFSLLADAAPSAGESFLDVGSGCGRLVLAAALAHSWETAAGVELLEHLHTSAQEAHTRLRAVLEGEPSVSLSPCRLVCAEADEALPSLLRSTCAPHVVFVFATCWPGAGPYLPNLSATLAANLRVGSRVITVDKQLVVRPDAAQLGRRAAVDAARCGCSALWMR
jgi:precorrin-6B methylase 2